MRTNLRFFYNFVKLFALFYRKNNTKRADISFNRHTYLRDTIVLPLYKWFCRNLRRALMIFIVALVANFVFSYFFTTPKMWNLREEANHSVERYVALQAELAQMSQEVQLLSQREKTLYRSVFAQDFAKLDDAPLIFAQEENFGRYNDLVNSTEQSLNDLTMDIYRASVSLDDIELLALNKDVMAERVPAIWPMDRNLVRGNIGKFSPYRRHPVLGYMRPHEGIDLSGWTGTDIVATGNGVVTEDNRRSGYGLQVLVDHGFGYKTRYAHLSKISVTVGQEVKRGQKIGELGSTGLSSGPHLHYEVILRGTPVDPLGYIARDMTSEEFQAIVDNMRDITYELEDESRRLGDEIKE